MRKILKYVKIIFCNLILITFLSQLLVNSAIMNFITLNSISYGEEIEFPKASKYTSQSEITSIWKEPDNYYSAGGCDNNVDNNPKFNSDAMIGVQGWHMGAGMNKSKYFSTNWNVPVKPFFDKFRNEIQTDGNLNYIMDGSDKCYTVAGGQAFGVTGERVDFTYKSQSTGKTITICTVFTDVKAPDDWIPQLGWFPEGPYGYYADFWGTNTIEFYGYSSVPNDQDFSEFGGGSDKGPWLLDSVDNKGGFKGYEPIGHRVSKDVAWPNGGHGNTGSTKLNANYVDLDNREFKFSGLPKTISYEGVTNPIANLFKELSKAVDILMGLIINGFKRIIIGWTRILEIAVNYVFYKTEEGMTEKSSDSNP